MAKKSTTLRPVKGALVLAACLAISIGSAHGQMGPKVGERGRVDKIQFQGIASFPTESVREALGRDAVILVASHSEAPLQGYLQALRQRTLEGYLQGGFPDANIAADLDAASGQVRVAVTEGPRFRCGDVKVSGTSAAIERDIVGHLTQPQNKMAGNSPSDPRSALGTKREESQAEPHWQKGEPVSFEHHAAEAIEKEVQTCLAEHGLFFPKLEVGLERKSETRTANLRVTVRAEGPKGRVSEIKVEGNRRHTREEILRYIDFKPGMTITRSKIAGAEERLLGSARFLTCEIKPEPAGNEGDAVTSVLLTVKVREYEEAPKLGEKLTKEQQAALRLGEWMAGLASRNDDLVLNFGVTQNPYLGDLSAQLILSPGQGLLLQLKPGGAAQRGASFRLLTRPGNVALFCDDTREKFAVRNPDTVVEGSLEIKGQPEKSESTNGQFNMNIAGGFRTMKTWEKASGKKAPFDFKLKLLPAAFLSLAEDPKQCSLSNQTFVMTRSNTVLRADAPSGRLLEYTVREPEVMAELRFASGAFEQAAREMEQTGTNYVNRYDERRPFSSFVNFCAARALEWRVLNTTNAPLADRREQAMALWKLLDAGVWEPVQKYFSTNQADAFSIPVSDAMVAQAYNPFMSMLAVGGWYVAEGALPRNSWPWTVCRATALVLLGHTEYVDGDLNQMYHSEETGPLGCVVIAELLSRFSPNTAQRFAMLGGTRLDEEDFQREWRIFLEGDSPLAQGLSRMAVALGELPPEQVAALAALLPADEGKLLTQAAAALRANPTAPPVQALSPVIGAYWQKNLRAKIRDTLQKLRMQPVNKA